MPQTFSQNGHTVWSMWTLWSSLHFEKPCFLVIEIVYQDFTFLEAKESETITCAKKCMDDLFSVQKVFFPFLIKSIHDDIF
jgi:hypothetical protein